MPQVLKLARVSPQHFPTLDPIPWPEYKTVNASGMDLYADLDPRGIDIPPGELAAIPTGLKMEIPEGFEGQVRSRSGLAFKNRVVVINSPGTIDADFRGEVLVGLVNHGPQLFHVNRGDRIAQLVICPVVTPEVLLVPETELTTTVRGVGGFGSTGVNDTPSKS